MSTVKIGGTSLLKRVLKKPLGKISFTFILILFVSAIFANFAAPSDPNEIDTANIFSKPSLEHLFGADDLGRDVLSRVMHGGRISLIIALFASAIAMIIGVLWGFLAAQIGGWVDDVLMRTVDALLSIPIILLALILVAALGTATHSKAYAAASLATKKVPDLFVNTGFSGFGNQAKYPTTFTVLPSYAMEAKIISKFVKDKFPGQAVALVAQDDEFGVDGVNGFAAGSLTLASKTLYPQSSMTDARAKALVTGLSAIPGKPVVILFGTTDVTALIFKAAESLNLVSKFTWIAGSVGGDANTLLALGVKATTIDGAIERKLLNPLLERFTKTGRTDEVLSREIRNIIEHQLNDRWNTAVNGLRSITTDKREENPGVTTLAGISVNSWNQLWVRNVNFERKGQQTFWPALETDKSPTRAAISANERALAATKSKEALAHGDQELAMDLINSGHGMVCEVNQSLKTEGDLKHFIVEY